MVYSSKDFESLWFLYQAEGLPKNISIEELTSPFGRRAKPSAQSTEFLLRQAAEPSGLPDFDKWYKKTHKGLKII